MNQSDIEKANEASVLKAYNKLKTTEAFLKLKKMQKKYRLAIQANVSHTVVEKVLKNNNIIL